MVVVAEFIEDTILFTAKKPEITAAGIRHADHVEHSIHKSWH
jgi:hypothetical protein